MVAILLKGGSAIKEEDFLEAIVLTDDLSDLGKTIRPIVELRRNLKIKGFVFHRVVLLFSLDYPQQNSRMKRLFCLAGEAHDHRSGVFTGTDDGFAVGDALLFARQGACGVHLSDF